MPINPGTFETLQPLTAKVMNTALYTYSPGDNFSPTGILFHANRPILVEALAFAATQASNPTGAITHLQETDAWRSYFDNSCLYGPGADAAFDNANGYLDPAVPGSSGGTADAGGNYMVWGFPAFSATTNTGASGALLTIGTGQTVGGKQISSITEHNCSYVLDITTIYNGTVASLDGWCADASSNSFNYVFGTVDYSGESTRFYAMYCGTTENQETVSLIPTPPTWNSNSTVSAATLNGEAVGEPLTLLNNPPTLRIATVLTGTVPATTLTLVPLTTTQIDTFNGWNNNTSSYTVPLNGIYLVHGTVSFSTSASANGAYAAINVNGTTTFYGPGYHNTTVPTMCQVTRIIDLYAGDVVTLGAYAAASYSYGVDPCRLCLVWLGAIAPSNTQLTWTPPVTAYRWTAGMSDADLTAAFQEHLTNDISFLLYKPYLLARQTAAQTGLSQGSYHIITMDTVGGPVHGAPGDSYGGWNSSENIYFAPVDGWYLVVATYTQSVPGTPPGSCVAGIAQNPPGSSEPDVYQHMSTGVTTLDPGADAIGLYFLRAGDSVQPQYMQQDAGSFNTVVSAGHQSTFTVIWVSE